MRYLLVGHDNIAFNAVEAAADHIFESGVRAIANEAGNIGDYYNGIDFEKPETLTLPEIYIINLTTDNPASIIATDFCDITCPAGTKITAIAELRSADGVLIPMNDTFRMPMTSSDGRTRYILVTMKAGIVSFSTVISEGGLWTISQNGINSALPPEKHMAIKDIKIYVCI